jgi:prepilin-type N-terminal cleavage/methylation domain-containing protein
VELSTERYDVKSRGFTLIETLVAMAVLGIMVVGIVAGFVQSQRAAEWSAYTFAAQSLAMQPIEQGRAARWDPYAGVPIDEVTNLPAITTNILDVPISGTNIVYATNRIWVRTISATPPLKEIYVECTWRFLNRGVFTNSVLTYRAPGQSGEEE